ncbi:leucine-rich repeat-containing protein 58 isoform X1 [Ixodes scapularis]|uniref:leucine-rich repeat-containing protein 58 isoform X1 n=1 Tax=Ixodes scapularis TaxID=6945 RepID=UPI001AD6705B|nr:leucine-rich repeat-containing protein 58 isoform X1 [Ixodes scapularis]
MADEERAAWGAGSELPADLQAPDGPEVLDLSRQGLDAPTADTNLALLDDTARVRVARLQHNLLERLPDRVGALSRLHTLDVSHNRLGALPEELGALPALRVLLAAGNRLRYLPKALAGLADLEVVNLSGNSLDALPPPLLALGSLRALYLGANRLECVPEDIGKLQKLEVLYLGGNRLQELPAGLGSLGQLQSLVLSGNRLVALPPSLSCLHRLRSLALHDNLLTTLPPCLVRLQNLVEVGFLGVLGAGASAPPLAAQPAGQPPGGALRAGPDLRAAPAAGVGGALRQDPSAALRGGGAPPRSAGLPRHRPALRQPSLQGGVLRCPGGAHQVCGLLRQVPAAAAPVPLFGPVQLAAGRVRLRVRGVR